MRAAEPRAMFVLVEIQRPAAPVFARGCWPRGRIVKSDPPLALWPCGGRPPDVTVSVQPLPAPAGERDGRSRPPSPPPPEVASTHVRMSRKRRGTGRRSSYP